MMLLQMTLILNGLNHMVYVLLLIGLMKSRTQLWQVLQFIPIAFHVDDHPDLAYFLLVSLQNDDRS
jgi:hypothetical protein